MTKLFKNSKSILSFVLAFAVLAVSLFTGVVIHSDAANCDDELNVVYITYGSNANGEPDGSFMDGTHGTGTETDPYVISTPGQLRHLAQKTTYAQTYGKFFEIDDSIDIMVLQSEAYINTVAGSLDAFLALDAEGVKDAFATTENRTIWQSGTATAKDCFAGTLNGNGVKIVGAYNNNGGIIAYVNDGATAKNLTVEHCMFETGWFAGSIFGYYYASDTYTATGPSNENCPGVITFDNITVHDNYSKVSGGGAKDSTGALFGDCANYIGVKVNGCLVYDCKLLAEAGSGTGNFVDHPFAFGDLATGHNGDPAGYPNGSYANSVFIGCAPWTYKSSNQAFKPAYYSSVYTDCAAPSYQPGGWADFDKFVGITVIGTANAKGAAAKTNMPNLDWANTWVAVDGEYPELRSNHNIKIVDNGDGTHKEACEDCGLNIGTAKHSFTAGVCACGYKAKCGEVVLYWDGTTTAPASKAAGTQADPIIINTAAELNYVLRQAGPGATTGKYFKVADGIDQIVLQPEGVLDVEALLACEDGAAVKAYFDTLDASTLKTWNGNGVFNGNIDGNGVQIVGLYDTTTNLAGLVGAFDGGKQFTKEAPGVDNVGNTIKGFTVSHSYLESNNRLGVFGSQAYSNGWGAYVAGTWTVDTCAVINCHIKQTVKAYGTGHSGIVAGDVNADVIKFNNLIVYGNDATDANGATLWIRGGGLNSQKIIVDGVETEEFNYCSTTNSIILGALPYMNDWARNRLNDPAAFSNVYTDAPVGEVAFTDGKTGFTYEESQLKSIEGLTGAELKEACTGLDWTNTFMATADMPTFRAMHDEVFGAATSNGAAGHSASCSCGLSVSLEPHKFVTDVEPAEWDSYYCEVCNYVCEHVSEEEGLVEYVGDCLTAAGYTYDCPICGYHEEAFEEIAGHTFTSNDAEAGADCQTPGTIAHKYCTSCEKNYAADADKLEPFENALTDLTGEKGECVPITDDSGIVYGADDNNHWTTCATCGEKIETTAHTGVITPNGAAGHKVVCDVCKYESDNAEHAFGDDNKCDTCEWECTAHDYKDGEIIELTFDQKYGENSELYKDICYYVEQICTICGQKGENKVIDHTVGEWETKPYSDSQPACAGDGYHTEVRVCTECYIEVDSKTVTDPKTGHSFEDVDAVEGTCMSTGTIAHKYCNACGNVFAADAADDEAYENALNPFDGSMDTPIDPENHSWVEFGSEADCDNDGVVAHKYCTECDELVVGEETVDVEVDWDEYYKYDDEGNPVGPGAIVSSNYNKYENAAIKDFIAENYADSGIEVPAYPEDDSDLEAMKAYFEAYDPIFYELSQIDENFSDAWGEYWLEYWATVQFEARYEYVTAAAEEAGVDFVVPAKGHTLVKVDEVAATYDKEGTKAHYACECGKLYSDAEGKNEVTAESLVIARLVKEDKPAGDGSTTSPVTGESVASVAAVAALVGAAFVLVRKSKKA